MICTRIFHRFPSYPSQFISYTHRIIFANIYQLQSLVLFGNVGQCASLHLNAFEIVSDAFFHAPHVAIDVVVPRERSRHHNSEEEVPEPSVVFDRNRHYYIIHTHSSMLTQKKGKEKIQPLYENAIYILAIFQGMGRDGFDYGYNFCNFQGLIVMRNNLPPNFPFQKKELQNTGKTAPAFLARHGHSPSDHSQKKIGVQRDGRWPQGEGGVSAKQIQTTEEESIASDQVSSCTSSEITTKPSKIQQKTHRQPRASSPLRYQPRSPLSPRHAPSPPVRECRPPGPPFSPIRATLKNLLQAKASPGGKHEQPFLGHPTHSNKDIKLSGSIRSNKTFAQAFHSPVKSLQKQNQILREENELLRRELSEIKKLMAVGSSKRDDMISNLRNTIKKEDGEIKELKVKLDIFTKKNAALATLIENKDEEIAFLNKKLADMEAELNQQKERNAERFEKLKERINLTLRSYGELQGKWNKAEMDWLNFKEKWMEEKGIYLHRIAFLEDYIANN